MSFSLGLQRVVPALDWGDIQVALGRLRLVFSSVIHSWWTCHVSLLNRELLLPRYSALIGWSDEWAFITEPSMINCKGLRSLGPMSVGVLSAVLIYILKVIQKSRVTIIYIPVKIVCIQFIFISIIEYLCSIWIIDWVILLRILILVMLVIGLEFLIVNSWHLVIDQLNLLVE